MQNLVELGRTESSTLSSEYGEGASASASTSSDVEAGCSTNSLHETDFYSPLHSGLESRSRTFCPPTSMDNLEDRESPLGLPVLVPVHTNDVLSPELLNSTSDSSRSVPDSSTRSRSFSRRRAGTANKRSVSTSSTTTASSSTSFRQRAINSRSETIDEESNVGGLRASLDSGMAAVRRWIRSRSASSDVSSNEAASFNNSPSRRSRCPDDNHFGHSEEGDMISFPSDHEDLINIENSSASSIFEDVSASQQEPDSSSQQFPSPGAVELNHNMLAYQSVRQRALSEPDGVRMRDILFQRALYVPQRSLLRRRFPGTTTQQLRRSGQRSRGNSMELSANGAIAASSQLSSSAAEVLTSSSQTLEATSDRSTGQGADANGQEVGNFDATDIGNRRNGSSMESSMSTDAEVDLQRDARNRWIRINRRFQLVVTIVAPVFSLLLFAILVCWVVLTSAYVVSIDKPCDVPLKIYFWLVTLQLVFDVFRNDIMRLFLRWDATSTNRIPCRVITYNTAYLMYALLVLRLGVNSIFLNDATTCNRTASQLFQVSKAFVSLSIAAWATIILGYLLPFCVVATLLTMNGYSPSSENHTGSAPNPFTIISAAMGAPPGCVDELPVVMLEDFPATYPMECCICMENFTGAEVIVETACSHVFHKQCCREWLRQARTCPVCRTDIPAGIESIGSQGQSTGPHVLSHHQATGLGFGPAARPFARNDLHHEMVNLIQIIRRHERRQRNRNRDEGGSGNGDAPHPRSAPVGMRDRAPRMELSRAVHSFGQP
jgi:hypothetical protein